MSASRLSHTHQFLLLLVLLSCYAYFVQPPGANALSRYDLVRAIVDDHSLSIDRYHENTVDKGFANGHFYSDKAFGLSLLAVPAYAALRASDRLFGNYRHDDQQIIHFLTVFSVALPSAALAVLVARFAQLLGLPARGSIAAALVFATATMSLPFATLFFGHQTASFFAFASAYLLFPLRTHRDSRRHHYLRALAAGLLAGVAAIVEYPTALVGFLLLGYVLAFFQDRRHAVAYVTGLLPAVVALAIYNQIAFGSLTKMSYVFVQDERFALAHRGLMGVSLPDPFTVLQLLFAGKGLLTNSPVLALAPLGMWLLWREKRARPETILCVSIVASFLIYNAGYYLPFGGWTPGPRFLLPALPFLCVPLAAMPMHVRWLRVLFLILACFSALIMFVATATTPLVSDVQRVPILDIWLPNLMNGDVAFNLGQWYFGLRGTASLMPLGVAIGLTLVAVWLASRRLVATKTTLALPAVLALVPMLWLPLLPSASPAAPSLSNGGAFVVEKTRAIHPVVQQGQSQEVLVTVRNGALPAHNVALWLAVSDASGAVRFEDWRYPLNFIPFEERQFSFQWVVSSDEEEGTRQLSARVLHWSWSFDLGHNEEMVAFAVVADGR